MANDLVFISWAGNAANEIAEWLATHIFAPVGGVNAYVSSQMPTGINWTDEVFKKLQRATAVLGIITDESVYRPWVLFELGAAYRKLERIPILRFCDIPKDGHPLSLFQSHDCRDDENVKRALRDLTFADPRFADSFENNFTKNLKHWHELKSNLFDSADGRAHARLSQTVRLLENSLRTFGSSNNVVAHPCMLEATCKSIEDVRNSLQSLATNRVLTLEASRYPEYLLHLQDKLKCRVTAIAFVNRTEEFWSLRFGDLIRDSTDKKSRRLFVFDHPDELHNLFDKVWDHALHYDVWISSAKRLFNICRKYKIEDDFSVLDDPSTKDQILAHYQGGRIHFSVERRTINEKLRAFDEMLNFADKITIERKNISTTDRQSIRERLILNSFGPSGHPSIPQHSHAISIFDYDNFEEDHPFFAEMHKKMITALIKHAKGKKSYRVLEVGAGTGHFTKRLLGLVPDMKIIAVEPDPPSCTILRRKFEPNLNMVEISESRITEYISNERFDCIVSSFADHHIQPSEKEVYFRHLTSMLVPGGLIIIGDEFLRDHDEGDYAAALKEYHNYIINLAELEGKWQLVKLEKDALSSGLADDDSRVDFKISIKKYLDLATTAGLDVLESTCVSDAKVAEHVGGIYVIVFQPKANV